MGADGGTFAQRSEMVRTKNDGGASLVEPMQLARLLWTLCRLSREPLSPPVVADDLGRLYNKHALLLHLATRCNSRQTAHLKRLADVTTLTLAKNLSYTPTAAESLSSASSSSGYQVPFECPLSQRPMNGKTRFVVLRTCGCAMAEVALKAVLAHPTTAKGTNKRKVSPTSATQSESESSASPTATEPNDNNTLPCPVCSTPFSPLTLTRTSLEAGGDIVLLNPSEAEEASMRTAMEARLTKAAKEAKERKEKKKAEAAAAAAAGQGDARETMEEEEEAVRRAAKQARKAEKARRKAEASEQPLVKRARLDGSGGAEKLHPTVSLAGSIAAQLAAQAKTSAALTNKQDLSPAMRSLYGMDPPKSDGRDTWMTRGTFNRFA